MKNIADVNSDDILTQLNNLNYDDTEDLKLLDDEDIKPINNSSIEDDLADFYMNYDTIKEVSQKNKKMDLYTEKPVDVPQSKHIEPVPAEKISFILCLCGF